MGVGGRGINFLVGCPHHRRVPISEQQVPVSAETAFDPFSTLVIALELSGKSWEVGAVVPALSRRPRRRLEPRDLAGLLKQLERWRPEAEHAGQTVRRVVVTHEVGRDGFWIARYLRTCGIEVEIMHPASIPVERKGRRAKTDRIDLDMLPRTFLAWLRGEPRVCSMVRIPDETAKDMRRPERERERLVSERIAMENRVENLLRLYGVDGFKPRLRKAAFHSRRQRSDRAGHRLRDWHRHEPLSNRRAPDRPAFAGESLGRSLSAQRRERRQAPLQPSAQRRTVRPPWCGARGPRPATRPAIYRYNSSD